MRVELEQGQRAPSGCASSKRRMWCAVQENQAKHFIQQRFMGIIAPLHVRMHSLLLSLCTGASTCHALDACQQIPTRRAIAWPALSLRKDQVGQ